MAIKLGSGDKIALVVIGAFVLLVIVALVTPRSNTNTTPSVVPTSTPPATAFTIDSVYEEFKSNKLAFAKKYNGKLVSISGNVSNIDAAINSEYVIVSGSDEYSKRAQCFMQDKGVLLNYKNGDPITVFGYPRDSIVGELTLEKCSVK